MISMAWLFPTVIDATDAFDAYEKRSMKIKILRVRYMQIRVCTDPYIISLRHYCTCRCTKTLIWLRKRFIYEELACWGNTLAKPGWLLQKRPMEVDTKIMVHNILKSYQCIEHVEWYITGADNKRKYIKYKKMQDHGNLSRYKWLKMSSNAWLQQKCNIAKFSLKRLISAVILGTTNRRHVGKFLNFT